MMLQFSRSFFIVLMAFSFLGMMGCRGTFSPDPPIHWNPNMDDQARFKVQSRNIFFADKRSLRPLVKGTVARGFLREDEAFFLGKVGGKYLRGLPRSLSFLSKEGLRLFLKRGQERYNIYCAPCHGYSGDGKGPIGDFSAAMNPADFHDSLRRIFPLGRFFEVVTKGKKIDKTIAMPSFSEQISPKDRWAIVAYIRALQLVLLPPNALKNEADDRQK